ncbi:hypothetical protein AVW09_13905 [Microbacterium sp. T32]|nr:hypothetical protein AVW09_13905 [Microbacterium sp. T32]
MIATAMTASTATPQPPSHTTMSAAAAPTAPAAGRVSTHPIVMRPTVPQRTVDPRRPRPEPITDPEATCVVERAKPRALDARIVAAVDVSAEKPCAGLTSVRPLPSVRMMRHPPMYVPSAIVSAHASTTQICGSGSDADCQPTVMRARVMTPIVFCASFVPCARATSDDVKI